MNKYFVNNWLAPRHFENEVRRLLHDEDNVRQRSFVPAADVTEREKDYLFTVSLPGLDKKDIKVEVNNDQITISGKRTSKVSAEEGRSHLAEIYYGTFSRTFTLPSTISEDGIVARFENGLLELTVPKAELPRARVIEIQ